MEKETLLNLLICVIWASVLLQYARGFFAHLPLLKDYLDSAEAICVAIPLLLALPALINKFCMADYLFYLAIVAYYFASYAFFPENSEYLTEYAFQCICCVFPFYMYGRLVNIEKWFDTFAWLSTACILVNVFYFFVYAQDNKNMEDIAGEDNMYAAYRLMPHVAFMLWASLEKFRIWKVFTFVCGFLFLLSCGTRGPFVCIGFFGVIYFFFYMNFKGAIYIKLGIIAVIAIIIANLTNVIYFLVKTFTGLKLSTRILEKIVTGELGNDSYRGVLRDQLYTVIGDGEHFWGLGIFGTMNYGIIYPHFLTLDFYCTFGYFVGIILLTLLGLLIAGALWLSRGKKSQIFIVFLFSISIIKLFLSNSFILEPFFYFLIGACAREFIIWLPTRTKIFSSK